jgi:hypothetical protein
MSTREEQLKAEGWIRQFVTEEPRLSEAVELYKSLGNEVLLEPVTMDDLEECGVCFAGSTDRYKLIYTRSLKK